MSIDVQLLTMIHMVLAGLYLGIGMGTYNRLRVRPKVAIAVFVQDVLFWLIQAIVVFLWLQWVNEGEVRIYIFISILLGFAMYKALLETTYLNVLETVIHISQRVAHTVLRLIQVLLITPVVYVWRIIVMLIVMIGGGLLQGLYVSGKTVWKALLIPLTFVYNKWKRPTAGDHTSPKNHVEEAEQKEGFLKRMTKWFKKKL